MNKSKIMLEPDENSTKEKISGEFRRRFTVREIHSPCNHFEGTSQCVVLRSARSLWPLRDAALLGAPAVALVGCGDSKLDHKPGPSKPLQNRGQWNGTGQRNSNASPVHQFNVGGHGDQSAGTCSRRGPPPRPTPPCATGYRSMLVVMLTITASQVPGRPAAELRHPRVAAPLRPGGTTSPRRASADAFEGCSAVSKRCPRAEGFRAEEPPTTDLKPARARMIGVPADVAAD